MTAVSRQPTQSPSAVELTGHVGSRKASLESLGRGRMNFTGEGGDVILSAAQTPMDHTNLGSSADVTGQNSRDFFASVDPSNLASPNPASPTATLRRNPITHLSKQYMNLLRTQSMAHCDRNQVKIRIESMSTETLQLIAKSLVDALEDFLDCCEELPLGKAALANATANSTATLSPQLPSKTPVLSRHPSQGSEGSSKEATWRSGRQLAHADATFASFASYMTTGSTRSMDGRVPISETHHLTKSQDEDGNKTINRYSVVADLGKGAYGKVKLGINNETNETVAVKIIKKSVLKKSSDPMALNREIAILKKARHQNVVSLYEVIDDPESDKLYLVMQYVSNGPIVRIKSDFTCTPLPEVVAKGYMKQILSGVRYLHKRGIVHHDLKPDNILLGSDGVVYITDFGVSEIVSIAAKDMGESMRRGVGTPIFSAPELVVLQMAAGGRAAHASDLGVTTEPPRQDETSTKGSPCDADREDDEKGEPRSRSSSGGFDGAASDTWSLGITFFLMLVGRVPFTGRSFSEVAEVIQKEPLMWTGVNTSGQSLDPRWREILDGMLHKDPRKRWPLKRVKNHPVFQDPDIDVVATRNAAKRNSIVVSKSEVQHATIKISHFIDEDKPSRAFSRHASLLAQGYVTKLRKRVSRPTASDGTGSQAGSPPSPPFSASPPAADKPFSRNPRYGHVPLESEHEHSAPPNFEEIFSLRRPTVAGSSDPVQASVDIHPEIPDDLSGDAH